MKRIYHIVSLFILITISSASCVNAQVNCKQLLKKKISMNDLEPSKIDSIFKDFAQLSACGLDSTALEIIGTPPLFATLIVPLMDSGKKNTTYQNIFDKIMEFQNSDEFPFFKKSHDASKALKNRTVDLKKWASDRELLLQIPLDSNEVEDFYNFLKDNPSNDYTYFDAWSIFKSIAKKQQETDGDTELEKAKKNSTQNIEDEMFAGKYDDMTLSEILQKADSINKNVVIYFTGWNHVNSRKLEFTLFDDKQLNAILLNEFLFVTLFTDDKTKINEIANHSKKPYTSSNITKGIRSQKIQQHYLGSKDIPAFILLDNKGKLIKSLSKKINKETLRRFLTEQI